MASSGETLVLHDGETVTIRTAAADSDGELLEMDVEWTPVAAHRPPVHLHPLQDERFEIREGELSVKLDGSVIYSKGIEPARRAAPVPQPVR